MSRHIVAITGMSGVGKSTLLRKLASTISFQCLQASALIREARQSERQQLTLDQLRSVDLGQNQRLLVDAFARAADQGAQLIILDAHTVIEQDDNLILIEPDIFRAIGINSMIVLVDDGTEIVNRRLNDKGRMRPIKSAEQIEREQDRAIRHAREICSLLEVPISVFNANAHIAVGDLLRSQIAPSSCCT